ncbi:MAG: hypothetical protein WCE74_04735, partial [Pseudolabrys sp.]
KTPTPTLNVQPITPVPIDQSGRAISMERRGELSQGVQFARGYAVADPAVFFLSPQHLGSFCQNLLSGRSYRIIVLYTSAARAQRWNSSFKRL